MAFTSICNRCPIQRRSIHASCAIARSHQACRIFVTPCGTQLMSSGLAESCRLSSWAPSSGIWAMRSDRWKSGARRLSAHPVLAPLLGRHSAPSVKGVTKGGLVRVTQRKGDVPGARVRNGEKLLYRTKMHLRENGREGRRWQGHHPFRRRSRGVERSPDHAGLERHGAAPSTASGRAGRQLEIPRCAASEVKLLCSTCLSSASLTTTTGASSEARHSDCISSTFFRVVTASPSSG